MRFFRCVARRMLERSPREGLVITPASLPREVPAGLYIGSGLTPSNRGFPLVSNRDRGTFDGGDNLPCGFRYGFLRHIALHGGGGDFSQST